MAKKIGKFMLFSIAIGSAIGATYYYIQKKCKGKDSVEEEDYDDFSEDEEKKETSNYVPLTPEETPSEEPTPEGSAEGTCPDKEETSFTPLTEQVAEASEKAEETIEEFFDEDDASDSKES